MFNDLLQNTLLVSTCVGLVFWVLNASTASLTRNQELCGQYLEKRNQGEVPSTKEAFVFWQMKMLSLGEPMVFMGAVGLSILAIFF